MRHRSIIALHMAPPSDYPPEESEYDVMTDEEEEHEKQVYQDLTSLLRDMHRVLVQCPMCPLSLLADVFQNAYVYKCFHWLMCHLS